MVNGKKVVLLCCSGVCFIVVVKCVIELGLEVYNVLEGFEGDFDESVYWGCKGGWCYYGLFWC